VHGQAFKKREISWVQKGGCRLSESDVVRVKLIKEELRTLVEEVGRAKKNLVLVVLPNRRDYHKQKYGVAGGHSGWVLQGERPPLA
jgi:hypothetical protein